MYHSLWNFNHFRGAGRDHWRPRHLYQLDPAIGRRRIDIQELDLAFTGVVLAMERGETFKKFGSEPQGWRLLLRELRGSKAAVVLLVILSFALVVPNIVAAGFSKIFVDDILIQHTTGWLVPLLIGMALTAALRAVLTIVRQSLLLRLQTKLAVVMISRFLWHVMSLPVEFFTQRHAGDIASRISANEQIARLLSSGIAINAFNLTSVLLFAAAMAIYDVNLTAICVVISLVNVLVLRFAGERRQDLSRSLAIEQGKLVGAAVGTVRAIETIKASGLEDEAFSQWTGIQAKALNAEQQLWSLLRHSRHAPDTALRTDRRGDPGCIGGLHSVIQGSLTLGSLVAFQSLMASFSEPVTNLVNYLGNFQTIKGALERLEDVYNYPLGDSRKGMAAAESFPPKLAGSIELRDVYFGYSALDPPLLDGLSFTIAPGSRVALVGLSGSGKSTLARLICGLYKTVER